MPKWFAARDKPDQLLAVNVNAQDGFDNVLFLLHHKNLQCFAH